MEEMSINLEDCTIGEIIEFLKLFPKDEHIIIPDPITSITFSDEGYGNYSNLWANISIIF